MVVSKMKYEILGYGGADKQDIDVLVEFVAADPGLGKLVDCVRLTMVKPIKENETKEMSMVVEIYPYNDKEAPRANKIESFKIEGKY
jgi:hypothetical protein